ncbi:MAG: BatA and WFA domain-containing protein [Salibacteraceae bacterium]
MVFSAPSLIWALSLLVIPVIIHLFHFKRYVRFQFSDVSLLNEIKNRSRTQNRLKHLLILLCRMAFIAFLVLAFAQPRIAPQSSAIDRSPEAVALFVDNSYSMTARSNTTTLLNEAIQKAYEVVMAYPADTRFQLITCEMDAKGQYLLNREDIISELDKIEPVPYTAKAMSVAAFHRELLEREELKNGVLYMISDFNQVLDSADGSAPKLNKVRAIPVRPVVAENIGVDSVWFDSPILQPLGTYALHIRITNYGSNAATNIPVEVRIGNQLVGAAVIDMVANSSTDTAMELTLPREQFVTGRVSLADEYLQFDNNYYFSSRIKETVRIIEISPQPTPAFATLFGGDGFSYEHMPPGQIQQNKVMASGFLIVSRLADWNAGIRALVKEFAKSGKNVLISFGPEYLPAYDSGFEEMAGWRPVVADTGKFTGADLQSAHHLFRNVFEDLPKNLNYPVSRLRWRISKGLYEHIISFADGSPLLLGSRVGSGQIYAITQPLDNKYGNFQRHALFVPAVVNMALSSGQVYPLAYRTDARYVAFGQNLDAEQTVLYHKESGYRFKPAKSQNGMITAGMVTKAGHYQLLVDDTLTGWLSFNHPRGESSMEIPERSKLASSLSVLSGDVEILDQEDNARIAAAIQRADLGQELWHIALIIALAFFILESLLIKLFSR